MQASGMHCALAFMPVWESRTPPLGISYLRGALSSHGISCKTFDFAARMTPTMATPFGDRELEESFRRDPTRLIAWKDEILAGGPDLIGFSIISTNMRFSRMLAEQIRKDSPSIPIVCGGPAFTPEQMVNINEALEFSDYVVQGEGERVLPQIIQALSNGTDVKAVRQIWYRDASGQAVFSGHAPLARLDDYSYPEFDDFDLSSYPMQFTAPMFFSRGCILNCSFCENKWNDRTQRTRTAEDVYKELIRNIEKYKIKEYLFNDDSLISYVTLKPIEEYCDRVLASGAVLPWHVFGTRIDRQLTPAYVAKLAKSGLTTVMLGVESFSSSVQKHMGKSANYELTDRVVRMFLDAGINTRIYIIYGYVNESDEDFEATFGWMDKYGHQLDCVSVHPFFLNERYMGTRPGTATRFGDDPWMWRSEQSSPQKRIDRFLRLIDLFEELRSRNRKFGYRIADPLTSNYLFSWDGAQRENLFKGWDEMKRMKAGAVLSQVRSSLLESASGVC